MINNCRILEKIFQKFKRIEAVPSEMYRNVMTIERFAHTPFGTFGKLQYGDFFCYTVENPWMDNEPYISCIPGGEYKMEWYDSPTHGKTLILEGDTVSKFDSNKDRFGILFHIGNTTDDVEGCIVVGDSLGLVSNKWAVYNSTKTFKSFIEYMRNKKSLPNLKIFDLEVSYE